MVDDPVEEALYALNNGHAMHFTRVSRDDVREKTQEEKVADTLRGLKKYKPGTIGILIEEDDGTFPGPTVVMTDRGWREIIIVDGKHVVRSEVIL